MFSFQDGHFGLLASFVVEYYAGGGRVRDVIHDFAELLYVKEGNFNEFLRFLKKNIFFFPKSTPLVLTNQWRAARNQKKLISVEFRAQISRRKQFSLLVKINK